MQEGAITQKMVNREQVLRFKQGVVEERQELLWLTKGDRNTKFFQAFATERKKSNTIKLSRREDGMLVEGGGMNEGPRD